MAHPPNALPPWAHVSVKVYSWLADHGSERSGESVKVGEMYVRAMDRRRNEVDRLFRRLKGYRRIFSRFEKLDVMFTAFINFALIADGSRLWYQDLSGLGCGLALGACA